MPSPLPVSGATPFRNLHNGLTFDQSSLFYIIRYSISAPTVA